MRKISDFKHKNGGYQRFAIVCKSKQETNAIMDLLIQNGCRADYRPRCLDKNHSVLEMKGWMDDDGTYHKKDGYTLYQAKDFLEEDKCIHHYEKIIDLIKFIE